MSVCRVVQIAIGHADSKAPENGRRTLKLTQSGALTGETPSPGQDDEPGGLDDWCVDGSFSHREPPADNGIADLPVEIPQEDSSNRIESREGAIISVVNIALCSGFQRASRLAPVQVAQYSPQLLTCGRQLVNDMMTQLRESSLSLNGALLVLAGFLGFFSALQLDLQRCILSVYVLFFGLLMCAISIGWKREVFERYFGFAYTPKGQLVFVLVAGNLAWLCGWVGWLVAAYTNVNAYQAWERAAANAVPFEYGNRWNNYAQAAI